MKLIKKINFIEENFSLLHAFCEVDPANLPSRSL